MAARETRKVKRFYEMANTEMNSFIAPNNIRFRDRLMKLMLQPSLPVNGSNEVTVTTLDEFKTRLKYIGRNINPQG